MCQQPPSKCVCVSMCLGVHTFVWKNQLNNQFYLSSVMYSLLAVQFTFVSKGSSNWSFASRILSLLSLKSHEYSETVPKQPAL